MSTQSMDIEKPGPGFVPDMPLRKDGATAEEVVIDGITYTTIQEGLAKILLPKEKDDRQVFYNPIQQFNRDLTIVMIKAFGEKFLEEAGKKKRNRHARGNKGKGVSSNNDGGHNAQKENGTNEDQAVSEEGLSTTTKIGEETQINLDKEMDVTTTTDTVPTNGESEQQLVKPRFAMLDALSASGLRALRYALEIPFVTTITANDMDTRALASMSRHITHNKVEDIVHPTLSNAIGHMYNIAYKESHESVKYHVVDLDPYGTAAPFLDAAVQALENGGLLCVTCTDAGVWASAAYPEKCFSLYGGLPVKGDYSHEAGLRIILFALATAAGKYGLAMEPLLSLSIDFYARVFVRIRKSPETVKLLASKSMTVYSCGGGCGSWKIQRLGTAKEMKPGGAWKYGIAQAPDQSGKFCEYCGTKTHVCFTKFLDSSKGIGTNFRRRKDCWSDVLRRHPLQGIP